MRLLSVTQGLRDKKMRGLQDIIEKIVGIEKIAFSISGYDDLRIIVTRALETREL